MQILSLFPHHQKGTQVNAHRTPLSRHRAALGGRRANGSVAFSGTRAPSAVGSGARAATRCATLALVSSTAIFAAMFALLTSAAPAAAAECSNEAIRTEQHAAFLPECRAYEMVTPLFKDAAEPENNDLEGANLIPIVGYVAASDGERLAWTTLDNLPEATSPGLNYLSTRGPAGWTTEGLIPPQSRENGVLCPWYAAIAGFSPNLEQAILADGWGQNNRTDLHGVGGLECGHDEPLLDPTEPQGFQNIFRRDNNSGGYELIDVTPPAVEPKDAQFLAGSADLSHVIFSSVARLTPDAPPTIEPGEENHNNGVEDLYEWSAGHVRLVTVLPASEGGAAVEGTLPWATLWERWEFPREPWPNNQTPMASGSTHTVSDDGSEVFFEAAGNLYVREDGTTTTRIDASQASGPGGGGKFLAATPDGSRVFFTDDAAAGLTADTLAGSGANLYEYDTESGALTDLTAAADARVLGLTGTSADGSYVYFVAEGALAPGATAGAPNLYLRHAGTTSFVASLAPRGPAEPQTLEFEQGDYCDWYAPCSTARVSPNGQFLAFTSIESLTGYDNEPLSESACRVFLNHHENCREAFLYDAGAGTLECASCNPSGEPPTGNAAIRQPGIPAHSLRLLAGLRSNNVTDRGQVFFDTPDGLLPRDANGKRDVYEFHAGQLHLLSTGLSGGASAFVGAGADGRDVFFITAERLVSRDQDSGVDVYDARSGGGFSEPGVNPPCSAELCRAAASQPPPSPTPVTAAFSGSGNVHPKRCRKGSVRRHGKCVKKHYRNRRHHRHHHRRKSANRRVAR